MTPIVTNEAGINIMTARQTLLALSTLHLYTDAGPDLTPSTTLAQLTAAEATYTGYLAKVFTTFPLPYVVPGGGVNLQGPTQQFQPTGTAVGNLIKGWWLATAAGEIQIAGQFDALIPMSDVTNAIPLDVILNQPNR